MAGSSGEMSSEEIILQVIGQQMALYPRNPTGSSSEVRIVQLPTTSGDTTVSLGSSCVASWPGNAPTVTIGTDPKKIFDLRTNTYTAVTGVSKDGFIQSTTVGESSMEMSDASTESFSSRLVKVEVRIPEDEELKARLALQRLEINDAITRESGTGGTANPFNQRLLCCPFIVCEEIVDDDNSLEDDDEHSDTYRLEEISAMRLPASSTMMVTLPVPNSFDLVVDERRRPPLYVINQVFKSNQ